MQPAQHPILHNGSPIKILLTGKNGQVGYELQHALAPLGAVTAIGRQDCDLANEFAIRDLICQLRPEIIVNAAAYTAVDQAELEGSTCHTINARVPAILGEEAAALGALVVHYSTDYVFDGTQSHPYQEDDFPNPLNSYGASKLAGEQALQATGARALILRTSWVYGIHGNNFIKNILRLATERSTLRIVADQWGTPTSAARIAEVTAQILQQLSSPQLATPSLSYGIYHLVANGVTNWHAYACRIIEHARASGTSTLVTPENISAILTKDYPTPAQRPRHSQLDNRKIQQTFGIHLPDWQVDVDHILEKLL